MFPKHKKIFFKNAHHSFFTGDDFLEIADFGLFSHFNLNSFNLCLN